MTACDWPESFPNNPMGCKREDTALRPSGQLGGAMPATKKRTAKKRVTRPRTKELDRIEEHVQSPREFAEIRITDPLVLVSYCQ